MASRSRQQKGRNINGVGSSLDAAIQDVNLVRNTCDVLPACDAFDSVSTLLTMMEVLPLL